MKIDWSPLRSELALWRAQNLILPVWWRDDDATSPSQELDQLVALSCDCDVPVHLAVIPKTATSALASYVEDTSALIPVVHGFAHKNHNPQDMKKSEFGAARDVEDAKRDIQTGFDTLDQLFGKRLAPMFVPPWNRMSPEMFPLLAEIGYASVSVFSPRDRVEACEGLTQINTHLDPIFWRKTRGLIPAPLLVEKMVGLLHDRRTGLTDNSEPLGYLTHHLVHTPDIWEFSRQILVELHEGQITLYRHETRHTKKDI